MSDLLYKFSVRPFPRARLKRLHKTYVRVFVYRSLSAMREAVLERNDIGEHDVSKSWGITIDGGSRDHAADIYLTCGKTMLEIVAHESYHAAVHIVERVSGWKLDTEEITAYATGNLTQGIVKQLLRRSRLPAKEAA